MASGQVSPKRGKVIDIPANAPTSVTATDLAAGGQVSVAFTPGSTATGGPVFSYTTISNPGSITGTGTSSPITVSGLTNDTAYTFTVAGVNGTGTGPYSAASNSATPTVPPTSFNSIATTTLSSSASSIEITGIPGTYKHLHIRCLARKDSQGYGYSYIKLNSTNGYWNNELRGYPYSTSVDKNSNQTYFQLTGASSNSSNTSNGWGTSIIEILDYADSSKVPLMRGRGGAPIGGGSYGQYIGVAQSQATGLGAAAVTSITFYADQGNFIAGTTLAIYGIG